MIKPTIPTNERERINVLHSFSILDTLPEEDYDNITTIASQLCQTQIALITLVDNDRQWFKSKFGLDVPETSRDVAFCAHAINDPYETFIVDDAHKDERFFDNPLVVGYPYIHFYAGVPLVTDEGLPLGTLCVLDDRPKVLSESQITSLRALSKQVVNLLELRRKKNQLEFTLQTLVEKQHDLECFAVVAAHDLKSPLNNMTMLIDVLTNEYKHVLDEDGQEFLMYLGDSAASLRKLIDGLLEYSRSDTLLEEKREEIFISDFMKNLEKLFVVNNTCQIKYISSLEYIYVNVASLMQILINLIANAVKYNDKEITIIEIGFSEQDKHYEFYVADNGPGIDPEHHEKIFKIFTVNASADKYGQKGNGIGLATVRKMIDKQGGTITIDSTLGSGAKFTFSLRK